MSASTRGAPQVPSLGAAALRSSTCLLVAATVEVLLHTVSLPKTCQILGIGFKRQATGDAEAAQGLGPEALRVAWRLDQLYHQYPLPDTCLRRALVAGRLLVEQRPELIVGVRTAPHFEAHAWLKVRGGILDWSERHAEFRRL